MSGIKMKILITTEQFYPLKTGMASSVGALSEQLVSLGHDVLVATGYQNRCFSEHNGVKIVEFKIRGGFFHYHYEGNEKQKYIDFVKNYECDVMINECTQIWSMDYLLDYLDELKAKKKFLHSHGFSLYRKLLRYKRIFINFKSIYKVYAYYKKLSKIFKKYDHIFLLHENTSGSEFLKKHGLCHYSFLSNGISSDFMAPYFKDFKDRKHIINISNYQPLKNQEFLMECYCKSKSSLKYSLKLIGDSGELYLSKLKNLKAKFDKKYGFRNVEFYFKISREQTEKLLNDAVLFLHSSKLEVFPMVIVESMAKAVPFISLKVGNVLALNMSYFIKKIDEILGDEDMWEKEAKLVYQKAKDGLNIKQIVAKFNDEFLK
ncbi:hypothetical protein CR66_06975 [Campylobacter mucosalis]|uniref:glycosyltransferase n=1 Tax=Campylobacter mucosalis TaxID=202 RepID=UPI0004D58D34|nr:glycosyltransferase [Campylobacter mucosalis]KEA45565.1 hypothetical protein CR66_06975 [Campylobacter mucosalis]QKF63263.1 glycosyltransferase, family 4 [Campylobacter mucosalis]